MNKKSVVGVFLILTLFLLVAQLYYISAADDNESTDAGVSGAGFDKAYTCLEDLVAERGYSNLNSEEQSFALLALAYDSSIQSSLKSALLASSKDNMCWPAASCKLRDTALALIALNYINQPTNNVENYLLEKTTTAKELVWYLQIDADEKTSCTLKTDSTTKTISIAADKKVSGTGGCFKSARDGYWLEISSDCYGDDIEISCDKAFITSLSYKKKTSTSIDEPIYISSSTNSAPAKSSVTEKVNALCFKSGSTSCDYEGSLWAALALKKAGKDTSAFMPYLVAYSSTNAKYLPSAFLYMITGYDEYFTELVNEQKAGNYWQQSDSSKQYYDTALALLALQGRSTDQVDTASTYLIENQPSSGCWRNARDTAFILYAADPKSPVLSSSRPDCEDSSYFCASSEDKCTAAKGNSLDDYYCQSLGKSVCCSVEVDETLPDVTNGGNEEEDTNECQDAGYSCKSYCSTETEDQKPYSCIGTESCCAPKTRASSSSGSGAWWIWLLVILIILLALAIIFRNQLKIWVFRIKNKFSKSPVSAQKRPPFPPYPPSQQPRMMGGLIPRRILPQGMFAPRPQAKPFPKQGELDATLRKLKEMGR